jgi:hypothetical protein
VTEPSTQAPAPLEAFYKTFVSIVYGFAASVTLQWWAETLATDVMAPLHWLMFFGVTLLCFHFWLICISTDDLENRIYAVLDLGKNKRLFAFLLVYSLGMSLALAFPIVVMARMCASQPLLFWQAYLALAAISLLYDVIALSILVFSKPRQQVGVAPTASTTYGTLFSAWLLQDSVILAIAGTIYLLRYFDIAGDLTLATLFLAVTVGHLIFDVIWSNPELYLSDGSS